jgi:DNA-binding transcriptional regulator GbsR (MarR family)
MENLSRDNLVETLKEMLDIVKKRPKDSYFVVNCEFAQIDKSFQEDVHKRNIERAKKEHEAAEKRAKKELSKKDNI